VSTRSFANVFRWALSLSAYRLKKKAWCLYIAVCQRVFQEIKLELHLVKEKLVFKNKGNVPLAFFSSRNSCFMNQKTCVVITVTCQIGCQFPFESFSYNFKRISTTTGIKQRSIFSKFDFKTRTKSGTSY